MIIDWEPLAPVVAFGDAVLNFNVGVGGEGTVFIPPTVARITYVRGEAIRVSLGGHTGAIRITYAGDSD